MCRECYGTKEHTVLMLNDILKHPDFEKMNTTSVAFLFYGMSNHHGEECKDLSFKVYIEYLKWYKNNKKDNYFPKHGMEQMYSQQCLKNISQFFINLSPLRINL